MEQAGSIKRSGQGTGEVEDMGIIYDQLGNQVNRLLTIDFIESGYSMDIFKKGGHIDV